MKLEPKLAAVAVTSTRASEGTIDFAAPFARMEGGGYEGWYNLGFGDQADKIRIRDWFATLI